ncbi:MAG: MEDS domain-containing protein [Bdellovibrionia bacterium]
MNLRKSGIAAVGDISWGTHFCQFYETSADLLGVLVPYFKVGLESGEYCLWVIGGPVTEELALGSLKSVMPNLDEHLKARNIEFVQSLSPPAKSGRCDGQEIMKSLDAKLKQALERGYVGMRLNDNVIWQAENDWSYICQCERELNRLIVNRPLVVMCSYATKSCGADKVLDVTGTHEFAIAVRRGRWEMIEVPQLKQAKAEINRINVALENRIKESQQYIESLTRERRLRRQFVSSLTHDIRNPLGAALLSAQLLTRKFPGNEQVHELTNRSVFAVQKADVLIQDLLDLNKILSDNPMPFKLMDLDLHDLLDNLVRSLSASEKGRFVLSCPRGIIGHWDEKSLSRAFEVLLRSGMASADAESPIFISVVEGPYVLIDIHFKGKAPWDVNRDRWELWWTLATGIISQHGGKLRAERMPTLDIRYFLELPLVMAQRAA